MKTDSEAVLAATAVFEDLDGDAIAALAALAEPRPLRCGEVLYRAGDPSVRFCVVASGRLRVTAGGALVGYVGRSEPVGEMGVVVGEPRTSTVEAVRDSTVLGFDGERLLDFLDEHPGALLKLSRLMIGRLREQGRERLRGATEEQGTIALIPTSPEVPGMELAEALVRRLAGWPEARLITGAHVDAALGEGIAGSSLDDGEATARLSRWLAELEGRHRYIVFAAAGDDDAWALRCLHNADRVLVLAEASAEPAGVPVLEELRAGGLVAPVELVLLRSEGDPSPHTLAWREHTGARAHYFIHPWDERELASFARQVAGRGVGLVLGGGGARGFAHIGLLRALEELAIPVDLIGGTSMGAFIGALLACGLDSTEIAHTARATFVTRNYLNDYALPRVSLIRGRRFAARLNDVFEERQIEELRRTYFCVSTNLTTGATVVHDRGPLFAWVGTSMSIPGFAPPVAYEGELLCDGGVVDNLPTDVMQSLERGPVLASNVSTEGDISAPGQGIGLPDAEALLNRRGRNGLPRLNEILVRSATLTSATSVARAVERADVYVRMPSQDFGLFDWKRIDELVDLGYRHAIEQLEPLRDKLAPAAA